MPHDIFEDGEPLFPGEPDAPDWDTIIAFYAGELPGHDEERIRAWMHASPERRARMEAIIGGWTRAAEQPFDDEVDALWNKFSSRAGLVSPRRSNPNLVLSVARHRTSASRWRRAVWVPIAAAAALLLYVRLSADDRQTTSIAEVGVREYTTKNAQRAEIRLADGSRVVLAPASRLTIPEDFGTKVRTLNLDGEAYFDVVHDDTRPFRVLSRHSVTRDIGTAFSVTDYAGDSLARVVVALGEVAVRGVAPESREQRLVRGDVARVADSSVVDRASGVDVEHKLAWVRGDGLVFDDVPLQDAVRQIARWYDLDIRLGDTSLETRRLVARIGEGPAEGALQLVALTLNVRYRKQGKVVTLYSR